MRYKEKLTENYLQDLDKQLRLTNQLLYKFVSLKLAFIRGVLTGLGGVLGATIVLAVILYILGKLAFVPIIGNFANQIVTFMNENPR